MTTDEAYAAIAAKLCAPVVVALPCGHYQTKHFAIHDARFEQCLSCGRIYRSEVEHA